MNEPSSAATSEMIQEPVALTSRKEITSKNGISIERNFRGVQPLHSRVEAPSFAPSFDNQSVYSAPRLIIKESDSEEISSEPVKIEGIEAPIVNSPVAPAPLEPVAPPPVVAAPVHTPVPQEVIRPPSPSALSQRSQRSTISKHIPPSTLDRLTGNESSTAGNVLKSWWKWALAIGAGIVIGNQFMPPLNSSGGGNIPTIHPLTSHPLVSAMRY